MSAKIEEIVLTPDPVDAEHLFPDGRNRFFHFGLWRFRRRSRFKPCLPWCGQGFSVHFSIGGKGQALERDEG